MSQLLKLLTNLPIKHFKPYTLTVLSHRFNSTSTSQVSEKQIKDLLQARFKDAQEITVEDVSGGCGAMFNVYVAAAEFKGLSIIKQHKTITETLKDQIKLIHGLRIETKVP